MESLIILLSGHFLADFTLQPKYMIEDKYRAFTTWLGTLTLLAHAITHGMILGYLALFVGMADPFTIGLIVGVTHFFIDLGKIKGRYGVMTDQVAHWLVILALFFL